MRLVLTFAALALLGACDRGAAPPAQDTAAEQIEGGDASDAMVPFESVRSVSPPDPDAAVAAAGAESDTADTGAPPRAEAAATASPPATAAPAETPAAEPE